MYYVTDYSKKISNNLIWVTGPARSGTTLFGKLISTTKNTEYFYEPELLFSLIPLIKQMKFDKWNLIYETYLSEELVFNSIVGRKLNFRLSDDSNVYNSFTQDQINFKLTNNLASRSFKKFISKKKIKIIIKIPDIIEDLIVIKKRFKRNKFIATDRNSFEILNSLIKKDWFNPKNIINNNFPLKISKNYKYPFWLPQNLFKKWKTCNSSERFAMYVILMKKKIKQLDPNYIVRYENLLNNPKKIIENVCEKFGLKPTKKTNQILKTVSKKNLKNNFFKRKYNIRKTLINQLENLN